MYFVDNNSGAPVMPAVKPQYSNEVLYFTEGGNGVAPTWPGADWFNIVQTEILHVLIAAGLTPDKADHTQLKKAMSKLFISRINPGTDLKEDGTALTFLENLGLADPDGAVLYPDLQMARWRDMGDVRGWGAKLNGIDDDAPAINAAALAVSLRGGGQVFIPAGIAAYGTDIIVYSLCHYRGEGHGATKLRQIAGSGATAFTTKDFDLLKGSGNLSAAPFLFSITDLSIDGNYMDLGGYFDEISWRVCDKVNNTQGSGIKIFGSNFEINVEINNCPEHLWYCEGVGNFYENQEHASDIRIKGRISGKELVVFRGPGDINLEKIVVGLGGLLPLSQRKTASTNPSTVYPGEPVNGLVLDNSGQYTGHAELGHVHIYGCSYGYGVVTKGTNRFNARHVTSENNLGGFYFGNGAHGMIAIGESRANGRWPDSYEGSTITPLPDVVVDNGDIWQLTGQMRIYRYSPSRDLAGASVQILGNDNNLVLTYASQLQTDQLPLDADFLKVTGNNNNISFQALRVKGNGVYVSGQGNNIRGTLHSLNAGTLLHRDGSGSYANIIEIVGTGLAADTTAFEATGAVSSEKINLVAAGTEGYIPFSGDRMAAINRTCVWEVMCTVGNSINGKSTEDYLEWLMPTPVSTGFGTGIFEVDIEHNFLYAPTVNQLSLDMRQPGTEATGANLEWVRFIGTPTTSSFRIRYKWSGVPTAGSAPVLMFHIK